MTSERHPLITEANLDRLQHVIEQHSEGRNAALAELLEQELARAEVTLCYPNEARSDGTRISVLAPVGAALIGLAVGQTIEWPVPGGRTQRLRIVAVPYQPEAAGHVNP